MKKLFAGCASAALLVTACGQASDTQDASAPQETPTVETASLPGAERVRRVETTSPDYWGEWGVDLSVRDQAVDPGSNFFMHVNGGWYDSFELPGDKTRYGAFDLLREKSEQQTRFIIEDLAAEAPPTATPDGKVAAMYNAFLDTDAINAAGLAPAQPYLDRIAAVETREDLAELFASPGFASPIGMYVWVDAKDPGTYRPQLSVSGLGLPDRDYYLKTDAKSEEIKASYGDLLAFFLERAGYEDAAAKAADVMALETELAQAHWDRATSRNRELTYNKLSADELEAFAGDFPLRTALDTLGIGDQQVFIASQIPPTDEEIADAGLTPEQVEEKIGGGIPAAMALAASADIETWKAYLTAHFLSDHAHVLPQEIDEANFAFYGTTLRGQPEQRPRWKRAVSTVESNLGEAIAAVYVERHFPPENKAAMDALVSNLRMAMKANLADLDWMGEETQAKALEKLNKFNPKIGYPEKFETYEGMQVGENALENDIAATRWSLEDNVARLQEDPDRNEWFMTPQTVNAYYNPSYNEIVFPAAILQPPFFNIKADPAVNYGAIGGVIGHEIGHGFDDQGSKYDGNGVLQNWWTKEDRTAFDTLGTALEQQYNQYCPLEEGEPCVNGKLSLGENIGDLGGLSLAYRAYQISLDTNGDGTISENEQAPVIDGLTGDQRFFLAWAQVWRSKYRDDAMRQQLLTGPHSPPEFRVNGIVRNLDEWYAAFEVSEDDALYLPPEERIRIW